MTAGTFIAFGMAGVTCLLFFALAAFGCSARADALTEKDERQAEIAAERAALGVGGGADFQNIHNGGISND